MAQNNTPQIPPTDRVAALRGASLLKVANLPATPTGFRPLTVAEQGELQKVAKQNEAELQQALSQLAERGLEVRYDLGMSAPDPARATALAERLEANSAARTRLAALLVYLEDINAVALHDAVLLFNEISQLLPNLKKEIPLQDRYSKVLEYAETAGLAPNTGHWFDGKIKQEPPASQKPAE